MVTRVVYAIDHSSVLDNICSELASVIVGNAARDFHVGVVVVSQRGCTLALPISPLTVSLVAKLRKAASETLQEIETSGQLLPLDTTDMDYREDMEPDLSELNPIVEFLGREGVAYNELLFVKNDRKVYQYPSRVTQLVGLKGAVYPRKPVRPVKVFDGNFTIGDPESPLLSVGVELYPATRRAKPPDVATYVNDRRVTNSSVLRTEKGSTVDPDTVQRGFMYLQELITVDDDLQQLMDAEFDGAERWPKAFEMLAVVDAVPPWLLMERTDHVVPKSEQDRIFMKTLNEVLLESKTNVLARLCHEPRRAPNGNKKLKGKLELVALQPHKSGRLTCTRVPFKEEFKSYYQFVEIPTEPAAGDEELDSMMDSLVDAMTVQKVPVPSTNPTIRRIDRFLINTIAQIPDQDTDQPNAEENALSPEKEAFVKSQSSKIMNLLGIVERNLTDDSGVSLTDVNGDAATSFDFI